MDKKMKKTLIKNVHILSMDKNMTEYKNGCILIEEDKIIFAGQYIDKELDKNIDITIDGKNKLAIPGFINTHTHSAMTIFRGYANDIPLWEWLTQKIWPQEDKLSPDDAYWLSMLAIAEMIQGGTTCFADMYMFMDQTAKAVSKSGIRAALSRGLQGPDSKSDMRLFENRQLWKDWNGEADGRIKVMVGPHAIYTCSYEYLIKCMDLANELNTSLHIHISETKKEVEDSIQKTGLTPVAYLNDMGFFDQPVLAAHCVHLTEEDMDILKKKNVHVAHCPASNLKLASGFAPIPTLLEKGINVSLGTDSASSNNNLSIIKEMALTALISKGIANDATLISAKQAIRMATVCGAKALGWENAIGSLESGKKADIVLIDTEKSHYYPKQDMITHLVYSGISSDVDTVIINGQILMENRELKTIDLDKVYYNVKKIENNIL